MHDRPVPGTPADHSAAAHAVDDAALAAEELALLWRLARRLQACGAVAEAATIAARVAAEVSGGSPALERAMAETVAAALEGLRERERLRSLALCDPLTGLSNRRFMEAELARHVIHVQREGRTLSVALLDLDHFRRYNERHGHLAGDLALRSLAVLLQGFSQGGDVPCRYGGEEFVLIMPGATAAQAAARLEPLRCRLAETGIHHEGRLLEPVTASIGVAECSGVAAAAAAVIDSADRAMYRAKRSGGNRICVAARAVDS
jgi:diguanylate cyclase (GGDEF)-like protein